MWVKIVEGSSSQFPTIYVTAPLYERWGTSNTISYGERTVSISVEKDKSLSANNESNSYNNPEIIRFSPDLIEKLALLGHLTYQIQENEPGLMLGPVVGFLLGEQQYYYHDRYLKELTDAMGGYEKIGGLFMAFRHFSLDWDRRIVHGLYYDSQKKKWSYGTMPIPQVIFRRGFLYGQSFVDRMRDQKDVKIFNEVRFDKWEMHRILSDHPTLGTLLPETKQLLHVYTIKKMLKQHGKVILKPIELSRGRGITVLKNYKKKIKVHDHKRITPYFINKKNLKNFLKNGEYLKGNYIVQQYINLAKIRGAPWDIRIVMQKDPNHQWKCSGFECRVAGSKRQVTNISGGGRALTIKQAFSESFNHKVDSDKVEADIIGICQEFCKVMDQTGYLFAEFGIDIAVDKELNYWFIEANVRPTFKGFKLIDNEVYKQLCQNPILFSSSLAGFTTEVRK